MLGEYKQAMHDGLRDLALRGEYRYFALMERAAGAFPDATTWGMVPDFRKYYSKTIARTLEPVGLTREAVVRCSNDYLGMGQSDVVKRAMHEAIETYGAGAGSTRNIAGTTLLHDELEATLAELHGKEAALLFGSGFAANEAELSTFGRLFQTAAGVESDLQRCFADWETQHRIEEFSLGEHDTPSRLWIPEKLYGRETEIDTLLTLGFARRLMAVLFTAILLVGCATAPGPTESQYAQIDGASATAPFLDRRL